MNWQQLFSIQKQLDDRIVSEHNLHAGDLFSKKILALHVELGELANETRTFKYWSTKPAAPRETILEEYVDVLHFVLSLGLDMGYGDQMETAPLPVYADDLREPSDLTETFVCMFRCVSEFAQSQSLRDYKWMFAGLIRLGESLGFSDEETRRAYLAKNEINHRRQAEGY